MAAFISDGQWQTGGSSPPPPPESTFNQQTTNVSQLQQQLNTALSDNKELKQVTVKRIMQIKSLESEKVKLKTELRDQSKAHNNQVNTLEKVQLGLQHENTRLRSRLLFVLHDMNTRACNTGNTSEPATDTAVPVPHNDAHPAAASHIEQNKAKTMSESAAAEAKNSSEFKTEISQAVDNHQCRLALLDNVDAENQQLVREMTQMKQAVQHEQHRNKQLMVALRDKDKAMSTLQTNLTNITLKHDSLQQQVHSLNAQLQIHTSATVVEHARSSGTARSQTGVPVSDAMDSGSSAGAGTVLSQSEKPSTTQAQHSEQTVPSAHVLSPELQQRVCAVRSEFVGLKQEWDTCRERARRDVNKTKTKVKHEIEQVKKQAVHVFGLMEQQRKEELEDEEKRTELLCAEFRTMAQQRDHLVLCQSRQVDNMLRQLTPEAKQTLLRMSQTQGLETEDQEDTGMDTAQAQIN